MYAEVKCWSQNYWEYWYRVYLIKNIKLRSITIPNGIYFTNSRRITFSVSPSFQYEYKFCYANFCLFLLPVGWMEMKLEMYFWMCFHLHELVLLLTKDSTLKIRTSVISIYFYLNQLFVVFGMELMEFDATVIQVRGLASYKTRFNPPFSKFENACTKSGIWQFLPIRFWCFLLFDFAMWLWTFRIDFPLSSVFLWFYFSLTYFFFFYFCRNELYFKN